MSWIIRLAVVVRIVVVAVAVVVLLLVAVKGRKVAVRFSVAAMSVAVQGTLPRLLAEHPPRPQSPFTAGSTSEFSYHYFSYSKLSLDIYDYYCYEWLLFSLKQCAIGQ